MESAKKRKLEAAGWQVGDATDFLGLTQAESELVEIKLRLAAAVQQRRNDAGLTQAQLAKRLGTSQPRVASMLAAKDVSIDNLVRSLLVLGADATEVARVLAGRKLRTAYWHNRPVNKACAERRGNGVSSSGGGSRRAKPEPGSSYRVLQRRR